ncbi:transcription factor TGA2.3-like isoform X4 [Rutidosis leptorrhynchoides]|uniref:transcription factor TGA2.3-like isoform X4 n=1 Tax=Rutidosis leptorrhynchoides TaxID=125765 RepID=UPI003A998F1B
MENGIDEDDDEEDGDLDEEVFEVDHILSICYGDSKRIKQYGLYLKAYVQLLETSRMKLTQLGQELQRARQQTTDAKEVCIQ